MSFELLEKVTSEAWVGFAGVAFGAVLTIVGVSLTNRANLKQLDKQLAHEERLTNGRVKKERLEELYILVCSWSNVFFGKYLRLTLVMKGDLDYNGYLDYINATEFKGVDYNRMTMIIDIYGRNFKASFDKVLKVRDEISHIESIHKEAYKQGQPGNLFLEPAGNAQLKLGKACDDFKKLISEAARTA